MNESELIRSAWWEVALVFQTGAIYSQKLNIEQWLKHLPALRPVFPVADIVEKLSYKFSKDDKLSQMHITVSYQSFH